MLYIRVRLLWTSKNVSISNNALLKRLLLLPVLMHGDRVTGGHKQWLRKVIRTKLRTMEWAPKEGNYGRLNYGLPALMWWALFLGTTLFNKTTMDYLRVSGSAPYPQVDLFKKTNLQFKVFLHRSGNLWLFIVFLAVHKCWASQFDRQNFTWSVWLIECVESGVALPLEQCRIIRDTVSPITLLIQKTSLIWSYLQPFLISNSFFFISDWK